MRGMRKTSTPHPEEQGNEGSLEILQPFWLQDDQSGSIQKLSDWSNNA